MPPTMDQLTQQLQDAVRDLYTVLNGNMHGLLRGTHEAVLAEAQGARIVANTAIQGDTYAHIQDLENTAQAIMTRESQVQSILGKIGEMDRGVMIRAKEALQPLLTNARQNMNLIYQTRTVAEELMETFPTRLQGVFFAARERTEAGLITTQIEQMAEQLRMRGIEPELIPQACATGRRLLASIRQMPVSLQDAATRVAMAAAAARTAFTTAARTAASSASSAFLRALSAAVEGIIALSGRLISVPIIIIDPKMLGRPPGGEEI
jgi:hypothetical protein